MQTNLSQALLNTPEGQRANDILRKCVHCGFCNATCPTHQVTGDELDGPRGRIYLIKEMLEGHSASQDTLHHLDNCLTCLNCETTCPSGVSYGELVEIGRSTIEKENVRGFISKLKRWFICQIFPYPNRFKPLYKIATFLRLEPKQTATSRTSTQNLTTPNNKVLVLDGCVQSVISPQINSGLNDILINNNIQPIYIKEAQCCGAIHHHNGSPEKALEIIKNNIDRWWPQIENNCDAILSTASGCGALLKHYHRLLEDDAAYAEKASKVSQLSQDVSEYLAEKNLLKRHNEYSTIAFHPPCSLQHDQGLTNIVEPLLKNAGYALVEFKDKHLCCGSAGTYSLLQPKMANQLKNNKLTSITQQSPDVIATSNIGCLLHLQKGTKIPVKHWLELVTTDKS